MIHRRMEQQEKVEERHQLQPSPPCLHGWKRKNWRTPRTSCWGRWDLGWIRLLSLQEETWPWMGRKRCELLLLLLEVQGSVTHFPSLRSRIRREEWS